MTMVTVLGGTGETGSRVAAKLRDRGVEVRAVSRSNAVPFDWSHEATWPAVLEGANAIYVIVDESPHWVERLGRFLDLSSARGAANRVVVR
ncbi:MAG: SDR family NAD(P)-dependent oxidoreductase, partial [Nocardioidaceae bacterium]|nr:SDR family NAD(P)-dependent oxidoreductase [Nocardioidaceae bacterium]